MKPYILILWVFLSVFFPVVCMAESIPVYGDDIDVEPPRSGMLIHGNTLYMTIGKQVAVFDISKPAAPVQLGQYTTGFFPQGLAVNKDGNRLFAADGRYLSVLDCSDPRKLKLRTRYLVSTDPAKGPVDTAWHDGKVYVATRGGGILCNREKLPLRDAGWARAVTILADGTIFGSFHSGCNQYALPTGSPGKAREFSDGRIVIANGFAGFAVIGTDKKVYATKDLNRFSSYGSRVYDVAEGMTPDTVLLAAGEIGIVSANIGDLNNIRYISSIYNWENITGLIRKGKYLFACDAASGLAVFDISNPQEMEQITVLPITKEKKGVQ